MNIGFIYTICAGITWGLVYTINQRILSNTSPITLLFIDSIVTAIVLLPVLFIDQGSIRSLLTSGKSNLLILFASIIFAIIANFLIYSGIKSVGASYASIIEIAYPFFVVLFTYLFFHVKPNMYFFIGGLLVFIGSAIIIYFQ